MKTDPGVADGGTWRECVPGELSEFAAKHRHRQQRRALLRNLSIAFAGFAAVGIAGVLTLPISLTQSASSKFESTSRRASIAQKD